MPKEQKPIDIVVTNIWGSWKDLKVAVKRDMKILTERGQQEEIGTQAFIRSLLGSTQLTQDEYRLCTQAIKMTVKYIEKESQKEVAQERERTIPEWVTESARRKEMRDAKGNVGAYRGQKGTKEKPGEKTGNLSPQDIEEPLRETHSHLDASQQKLR